MTEDAEWRQLEAEGQLAELEERIAEYFAKKAWYEAKLVELAARRVELYKRITGSAPAAHYLLYDRRMMKAAAELEALGPDLRALADRVQSAAGELSGSMGLNRGVELNSPGFEHREPETAVEQKRGAGADTAALDMLKSVLAGSSGSQGGAGSEAESADVRKLALQLLPQLLKETKPQEGEDDQEGTDVEKE
jgi:hypothetical protein